MDDGGVITNRAGTYSLRVAVHRLNTARKTRPMTIAIAATTTPPMIAHPWGKDGKPVAVNAEPRVNRLVLLAPSVGWFAAPGALADVTASIAVHTGAADTMAPPGTASLLRSAPVKVTVTEHPHVGHFDFMTTLPPTVQPSPGLVHPAFLKQLAAALVTAIDATLFSLALLALLVTGIDAAIGRRRQLASLARIGVPTRMAGTAQAWQTAVPAAFGGLLAAGTGLLAGTGYLAIAGIQAATPWPDALLFATSVVIGALLAAVICAAAVGRTRPQDLQRE